MRFIQSKVSDNLAFYICDITFIFLSYLKRMISRYFPYQKYDISITIILVLVECIGYTECDYMVDCLIVTKTFKRKRNTYEKQRDCGH